MIRTILLLVTAMQLLWSMEHLQLAPEKHSLSAKIEILDSVVLMLPEIDGVPFRDISALAYDSNHDLLYMLGDKGSLFTSRLRIEDERIVSFVPVSGKYLQTGQRRLLLKPYRDSEGMAIVQKGEKKRLLISFEHRPRIVEYGTDGIALRELKLPKILRKKHYYQGRNRMLEGLTVDSLYGIITAPELPLRKQRRGYHALYSSKGEICKIPSSEGYSITELESIGKAELLMLERKLDFGSLGFDIRLLRISLKPVKGLCKAETVVEMKKSDGWQTDNFEGLCHYRDDLFLMISDDNGNPFQRTILTLFRLR